MTAPAYLPYYVLGGGVAIIATILIGLNRALVRGNWTQQERVAAIRLVSFVLIRLVCRQRRPGLARGLPRGVGPDSHYSIWSVHPDPNRQRSDLAIRIRGPPYRRGPAALDRRRAALSGAWADLPGALRRGTAARPLRLAGWRRRHGDRPQRPPHRTPLCAQS